MKTERRISSGFTAVFPKLTKKSRLRGTSRRPSAGITWGSLCKILSFFCSRVLCDFFPLYYKLSPRFSQPTVWYDAHSAVPGSQNNIQVGVWIRTHDVSPKRLSRAKINKYRQKYTEIHKLIKQGKEEEENDHTLCVCKSICGTSRWEMTIKRKNMKSKTNLLNEKTQLHTSCIESQQELKLFSSIPFLNVLFVFNPKHK